MAMRPIWDKLKSVPAIRLVAIIAGALVMAVVLYTLLLVLIWVVYHIPGLSAVVKDLAGDIGVGTSQLLEFNAIIVTAIFVAVQLWVTNRRATLPKLPQKPRPSLQRRPPIPRNPRSAATRRDNSRMPLRSWGAIRQL